MNNNYNPERQDRPRKWFNSLPVYTETGRDISQKQREQAAQRIQDLIQKTQSDLYEDNL
jgi:hypothetical protein